MHYLIIHQILTLEIDLVIDTTPALDNPLRFRKNLLERI